MKILVVDDDPALGKMLKHGIEMWGHGVEIAYSGKEAVKRLEKSVFHGMLLDIFLPDCQGHTLIPRFRALNPQIHILAMTGFNSRDLELEVRKQGVDLYLGKPVDLKILEMSLDHMARRMGTFQDDRNGN